MKKGIIKIGAIILIIVLILGGFLLFRKPKKLEEIPSKEKITIEGKEYYKYYDMGMSMDSIPESPIYTYAIREDNSSYKILSIHKDGTNYDILAINEKLITTLNDGTDVSNYYKLVKIDDKLYFMRFAYYNNEEKNMEYDIEIYYINLTTEFPSLELILQEGKELDIKYPLDSVAINKDNFYYYNKSLNNKEIKVTSLVKGKKGDIILPTPLNDFFFNDNNLYYTYSDKQYIGLDNHEDYENYFKVNINEKEDGTNKYEKLSYENFSLVVPNSSFNQVNYFEQENGYLNLYAGGKLIELQGFDLSEEGNEEISGTVLFADNDEIIRHIPQHEDDKLKLLHVDKDIVTYCIENLHTCDNIYSYNVKTKETIETPETYHYFLVLVSEE